MWEEFRNHSGDEAAKKHTGGAEDEAAAHLMRSLTSLVRSLSIMKVCEAWWGGIEKGVIDHFLGQRLAASIFVPNSMRTRSSKQAFFLRVKEHQHLPSRARARISGAMEEPRILVRRDECRSALLRM